MCMYENVTERYKSCGHDVPKLGPLVYNCPRYIKQFAQFREADRKWREGSQERCPPTPFNMFSCSDRETVQKTVSVEVPGSCWQCIDRAKQTDLRVKLRNWPEREDELFIRRMPVSYRSRDAGYEMERPLTPMSLSLDDEEEGEGSCSYPAVVVCPKIGKPPRRSQRLAEQARKPSISTTPAVASPRGRTSQRRG